jgi:hypothetical protein
MGKMKAQEHNGMENCVLITDGTEINRVCELHSARPIAPDGIDRRPSDYILRLFRAFKRANDIIGQYLGRS